MSQSPSPSKKAKIRITAAIPCFNTELSIGNVIRRVKKYVDHVVVVDDGSHDGTARAARDSGATVKSHQKNRGYGGAIMSCFQAAKEYSADILVILDGDGQHNPDETPKLLAPVLNGEADLVIGSRFLHPAKQTSVPRYRAFGIGVITRLFNFGARTKVSDAQSGYRIYSKKVFDNLLLAEQGMGVSIEILEKAVKRGARIKEVPITCSYSPSKLNREAIKHGFTVALSVIRIRLKNSLLPGTKK